MAYKALKDADGKICVDSNGNIMLVDMGSTPGPGPGPTPTGITNGVAMEYEDNFYVLDGATYEVAGPSPLSQIYDVIENYPGELAGLVRTVGITLSGSNPVYEGWTEIKSGPAFYTSNHSYTLETMYLANISGLENAQYITDVGGGYPLGIKALYDACCASEYTINLNNAEYISGYQGSRWVDCQSGFGSAGLIPIIPIIDMTTGGFKSGITSESAVYKMWSAMGIDVLDWMSTHVASVAFSDMNLAGAQHYTLNMPNLRAAETDIINVTGTTGVSLYFGSQITKVAQGGGSNIDIYIPRTDAVPVGSVSADINVYVPADMVAAYQAANGWSNCSIHAYTF